MYHMILRKVLMYSQNMYMRYFIILSMNNSYFLEQIYILEFVIESISHVYPMRWSLRPKYC